MNDKPLKEITTTFLSLRRNKWYYLFSQLSHIIPEISNFEMPVNLIQFEVEQKTGLNFNSAAFNHAYNRYRKKTMNHFHKGQKQPSAVSSMINSTSCDGI